MNWKNVLARLYGLFEVLVNTQYPLWPVVNDYVNDKFRGKFKIKSKINYVKNIILIPDTVFEYTCWFMGDC